MNPIKRFILNSYKQIEVRKELYTLRDWRVVRPILGKTLFEAARTWPRVLPRKWKPGTIIDVGAYDGRVSKDLKELYHPEFIGIVEPWPEMAERLRSTFFAPRQKIFSCALGRQRRKASLNVLPATASNTMLEPSPNLSTQYSRDIQKVGTIEVDMRTLDDIFSECELSTLDLLKVDVEGYELEVFAGGIETLRRTKLIVVEVVFFEAHKGRPLFKDIYDFLWENGFEMISTFNWGYNSCNIPLQCDVVFINKAMTGSK